jgi:hypothetical protein
LGLFSGEEGVHIGLAREVELGVGTENEIGQAVGLELADDCGAD